MRFLIIDDDPEFRRLLRYHVEVEWPDALVDERQPSSAGRSPDDIALTGVDAVLLGYPIGAESGFSWLAQLRGRAACPPVVLFASPSSEFLAVDALKAGAASYFPKSAITHCRLVETLRAEVLRAAELADVAGDGGSTGIGGSPGAGGSASASGLAGRGFTGTGGFGAARRHRLLERLHTSDLSSVYLAEAEGGGEQVACKVVQHVADAKGGRLFDRFLQEYEVVAAVRHPHVVRIFDLGIADDHAYIVMEYFAGGTLADRLAGPLAAGAALDYVQQIGSALGAIHAAGILHRDLKPANVMFRPDDTLALIDFGLAKQLRLHSAMTGTGQIFGTPYYMSPEQGHAEPTDARSDLYSLGCMLYEMLTGEKPFVASSAMGVIYKHAHAPRPRLPKRLARLQAPLERMLAVDPRDRYQSALELLEDLV